MKILILFFFSCILAISSNSFSYYNDSTLQTEVKWAVHEQPLLVAVGNIDYNGDKLKPGKYKARSVRHVSRKNPEIFDIIIFKQELSMRQALAAIKDSYSSRCYENKRYCKSKIKGFYHFAIGGNSGYEAEFAVKKGDHIHIIPNEYQESLKGDVPRKMSGVLELKRAGN